MFGDLIHEWLHTIVIIALVAILWLFAWARSINEAAEKGYYPATSVTLNQPGQQ